MRVETLKGQGYVELINVFGKDEDIAKAARVTTQSDQKGVRGLIRYLMRNGHTTPFEQCEMVFIMKMPLSIIKHFIRYRTANLQEQSGRYSEFDCEFYIPDDRVEMNKVQLALMEASYQKNYDLYNLLISEGVAKEVARNVLPGAAMTTLQFKLDLNNLTKLLKQRLDPHTQKETREYAEAIDILFKKSFPLSYEAYSDYIKHTMNFSYMEWLIIRLYLQKSMDKQVVSTFDEWITSEPAAQQCKALMSENEYNDFIKKIEEL